MPCAATTPSEKGQSPMKSPMTNLQDVDWSTIPAPQDDGATQHLTGMAMPDLDLPGTAGTAVNLSKIAGRSVVYAYPMTGRPDVVLPDGWDMIPGARGCTPQSCAFRDHARELSELGVDHIFGLSTQDTAYQREAAERLHLPFPLLSDAELNVATALRLPTFEADGMTLLKRVTLIVDDATISKVFYPIFPPDTNAALVAEWLRGQAG